MEIEERLSRLPTSPGVYIMKSKGGAILYIGKAKNLRTRVRSYFRKTSDTRYAAKFLAARVEEIDYIVTSNEKEALILEETLLKKHKPRYNIRLKDDKSYLSIKITTAEKFPRILTTRRIKKDGSRYFGPYASAAMARETVKFLRRIFPLCVCGPSEFRNRVRPCLDYQLRICSSPAVGFITEADYRVLVDGAILFLEGKNRVLISKLKREMREASARLDYEEAMLLRDRIAALEATLEEQKVVSASGLDQDLFALAREDKLLAVKILSIRDGRLVASNEYTFTDNLLPEPEILSSLLSQYYRGERYIPDELIIPVVLEDAAFLSEWLSGRKGRKVRLLRPRRGEKLSLLKMTEANAKEVLVKKREEGEASERVLEALSKRLRLASTPRTIEAYDISNIGGKHAVGAMVSFADAEPNRSSYRLYKIKTVSGQDDYAMLFEVLSRRFSSALPRPDLVLIDGGKGQLSMAVEVFKELDVRDVALCSLAKERGTGAAGAAEKKGERVFLPNVKDPIMLRAGRAEDLLLIRIRDEVHRSAIGYHRKLRGKTVASALDLVPGIGVKRRRALFERFTDIAGIRKAAIEELTALPGITEKLAREIKARLGK